MQNNLPDELVINGTVYMKQRIRDEQPQRAEPVRTNGIKCDCGLPAKSYQGVAKTGRKAGEGYIKYYCPADRCDFKKFVDA